MTWQLVFHVERRSADEPTTDEDYTLSEAEAKESMPKIYGLLEWGGTVELTSHDGLDYLKVEAERRPLPTLGEMYA